MFMSANTLAADTGNNCMYSKVLSLYETVISICIYPKVSSLYETVTYACNDPNGIYVIDPNGTSISINCMLQQLCPYLPLYQVLSRQSNYISHSVHISYSRIIIVIRQSYAIFTTIYLYLCIFHISFNFNLLYSQFFTIHVTIFLSFVHF